MPNETFVRIDRTMKEKGKKHQELIDFLGLTRNSYDNWKNGKSKSFEKYLDKIADFLNVTPSYLAYGIDMPPTPFEKEQEDKLIRLFRKVNQDVKNSVLIMLEATI